FARYAKDMLEKQTYPEVRRGPNALPEPPYDVTAWSLGMLLGVDTAFVKDPLPSELKLTRVEFESDGTVRGAAPKDVGSGSGNKFGFDYHGPDTAIAINRLLKEGAHAAFDGPSHVSVTGISRGKVEQVARDHGLVVKGSESPKEPRPRTNDQRPSTNDQRPTTTDQRLTTNDQVAFHAPRVAMYQPW